MCFRATIRLGLACVLTILASICMASDVMGTVEFGRKGAAREAVVYLEGGEKGCADAAGGRGPAP